jgi:exopolysaccharide production protein ExoY
VSGRNRLSYRTRVALDTRYVRAWSLWRDLWILVRTIPAVLKTDDTA